MLSAAVVFAVFAVEAQAVATPSYTAQAIADEIASLPGAGGPLASRQFSGFVDGGGDGDRLHYWLVESERDPGSDPLALWLNGGPGASSLMGYLTELGPYVISADGGIHYNPYTWAKKSNVVFLEAPAGVGFSYCGGNTSKACYADDDTTAAGSLQALRSLLDRFPALQGRDFMAWGESYAGVYVPTLSQRIADAEPPLPVNFLGFSVGNPCTDDKVQEADLDMNPGYAFRMGLIDEHLYKDLKSGVCSTGEGDNGHGSGRRACPATWRRFDLLTSGLEPNAPTAQMPGLGGGAGFLDGYDTGSYVGSMNPYWAAVADYLNRDDVRRALHMEALPAWSLFASQLTYETQYLACGDLSNNNAAHQYNKSVLPIYRDLTSAGYSVLLYSGDQDPSVQWAGSEKSVRSVGHPEAEARGWRPWFYQEEAVSIDLLAVKAPEWGPSLSAAPRRGDDAVLGGYIVEFEAPGSLAFATVRGVGHMVPQFRPQPALHLFDRTMSAASARRGAPPRLAPPLPAGVAGGPPGDLSDAEWYGSAVQVGAAGRWLSEAQAVGLGGSAQPQALAARPAAASFEASVAPAVLAAAAAGALVGALAMRMATPRGGREVHLGERLL